MPEQPLTDTQRIEQLEQEVAALTARLAQLEATLSPNLTELTHSLFSAVEGSKQSDSLNHFQ